MAHGLSHRLRFGGHRGPRPRLYRPGQGESGDRRYRPDRPISPSTAAGSSIYLIVSVLVPTATALASAWTMPRARAAGLGLTLACALPVPVLVTAWAAWTLPAYVPRRGYFVTTFLIIGVVGGLFGALPTWLIRRRRSSGLAG